VAYTNKGGQHLGETRTRVFRDPVVTPIIEQKLGRSIPHAFGIVQPTVQNLQTELKKSDRVSVYEISPDEEMEVLTLVNTMFAKYQHRFRRIPWEASILDPSASAGFPYGCDKEDALKEYSPYYQWYCDRANLSRPHPVFINNPKNEYLTIEQILNDKIRIFRNPPLEYLLLEKMYYQEAEDFLMDDCLNTWSALGFTKEFGGWHTFIEHLMYSYPTKRVRKYVRWDVERWDKCYGPQHEQVCVKIRLPWFKELDELDIENIKWLAEQASFSIEILPNGEIVLTAITQKSGRLLTSSNNTLMHIFILIFHYVRMSKKMGITPTFEHMIRTLIVAIYSDDAQCSSDYADEYLREEDLKETYSKFGFGIKEYHCSSNPFEIHFLGCYNARWNNTWVPLYDENRMLYAMCYTAGKLSARERTQRICGLAHNMAFSPNYADLVIELCQELKSIGQWVGAPELNLDDLKIAFTPAGLLASEYRGPKNSNKGSVIPENLNWPVLTSTILSVIEHLLSTHLSVSTTCWKNCTKKKEVSKSNEERLRNWRSLFNYSKQLILGKKQKFTKSLFQTYKKFMSTKKNGKPKGRKGPRARPVVEIITAPNMRFPAQSRLPRTNVKVARMGPKVKQVKRAVRASVNHYLKTLVLPELYGGIRYPDGYVTHTAMSKLILEQEVPFIPSTGIVEPPGAYYGIWRASLVHPFWAYQFYANTLNPNFNLEEQNARFGLFPLVAGTLNPALQEKQMILQHSIISNLKMGKNFANQDWVEDPYIGTDSSGNTFYGHTFAGGTGAVTATINALVTGAVNAGDQITFYGVNNATTVNAVVTATAGQTAFQTTLTLTSLFTVDTSFGGAGQTGCGRPGIGFRIKYQSNTNASAAVVLNSISFNLNLSSTPINQLGLVPYDFPDMQQLVQKLTVYRPVSSSAWCAYEGSTLNDGGQHTALMYRGGQHPNTAGISSYGAISQVDGAYEDKINKGSYSFYTPVSTRDTQMREPINSSEWTHPYVVFAGSVATTTGNNNPMRLRAVTNIEFCSPSQLWSYGTNVPNPGAIKEASMILRDAPTSMSNDSHLETIWNWLKGAAAKVGNFWNDNKAWIGPLASGVGAALL